MQYSDYSVSGSAHSSQITRKGSYGTVQYKQFIYKAKLAEGSAKSFIHDGSFIFIFFIHSISRCNSTCSGGHFAFILSRVSLNVTKAF